MKPKFKALVLAGGISLGIASVAISVTAGTQNLKPASAAQYSLLLNSSKAPSELTDTYQDTIQTSVLTDSGYALTFNFVLAKASSGNYVQLANNGYLYNFGNANGRIKGITAITPTLSAGSLSLRTTNSELSSGGSFLGASTSLTSGSRYTLDNPMRYFELKAGDSGATIKSILIEYSCSGDPSSVTTESEYVVENFEGYTAQGIGYDGSHSKSSTTNLRSAYYATYRGTSTPDPTLETGWGVMGKDDYLSLLLCFYP